MLSEPFEQIDLYEQKKNMSDEKSGESESKHHFSLFCLYCKTNIVRIQKAKKRKREFASAKKRIERSSRIRATGNRSNQREK
jgi:hypothetical protein